MNSDDSSDVDVYYEDIPSDDEDNDCDDHDHDLDDDNVCQDINYDDGILPEEDSNASSKQKSYIVLSEADIRQRIEDGITELTTVFSISKVEAGILLRHYNWVVSKVQEEWCADEERVRKAVGLLEKPVVDISNARQLTCGICFDTFPKDDIYSASCGHPFCSLCWGGYISTAINDGPGCLTLRCPDPGCAAAVSQDMADALGSEDDQPKYLQYILRSYIQVNKNIKWCPAPGCDYAVHLEPDSASYDVICGCSYSFCWNCTEEAHRPVDCGTVAKWILKNASESENTTWILAYSKPCPKCKRPIEKHTGCMHMTCAPPCRYEFCWLCLGDYRSHNSSVCNGYRRENEQEGILDEAEQIRKKARRYLERYNHYYERWAANHKSWQKAIEDRQKMQDLHLARLSDIQNKPETKLEFIIEGWSQIVECRRVLKWTYAYGYYLPEEDRAKTRFFEYLQGEAEAGLERLHHCAETELEQYLTAEGPSQGFDEFHRKLNNLTKVTGTYFENLVRALENGLSEMGSTREKDDVDGGYWACDRCTYINACSVTSCQMCNPLSL